MDEILTDEVKEELLDIVPESALPYIEGACRMYLDFEDCQFPPPKQERQHLEELSTAVEEAQEALEKVRHLAGRTPTRLKVNILKNFLSLFPTEVHPTELWEEIIKEATTPITAPLLLALSGLAVRKKNPIARDHILVKFLIVFYERLTDHEAYRKMGESGPIHRIIEALNPILKCGTLAGVIREELDNYKTALN